MSEHDAFEDRRRALEEQFFVEHDEKLLQKLREQQAASSTKAELSRLTGITQDEVLDALVALNLGAGPAVMVMSIYPLVAVAWADGSITDKERALILEQGKALGLEPGGAAEAYLTQWLHAKPEPRWRELWEHYVRALVKKMKPDDVALLKSTVVGRAQLVAEASGGFLGVAYRISEAEKQLLAHLGQAFE